MEMSCASYKKARYQLRSTRMSCFISDTFAMKGLYNREKTEIKLRMLTDGYEGLFRIAPNRIEEIAARDQKRKK